MHFNQSMEKHLLSAFEAFFSALNQQSLTARASAATDVGCAFALLALALLSLIFTVSLFGQPAMDKLRGFLRRGEAGTDRAR